MMGETYLVPGAILEGQLASPVLDTLNILPAPEVVVRRTMCLFLDSQGPIMLVPTQCMFSYPS